MKPMTELQFYAGIALMAGAVVASAVAAAAFRLSKKRLWKQLEAEYGKKCR